MTTPDPTTPPTTSIGGATDRLPALEVDDQAILVIPVTVTAAGYGRAGGAIVRKQAAKLEDAFVLPDEVGRQVVAKLRTARNLAENAARGITTLPGFTDDRNAELSGYDVDDSGNVDRPFAGADDIAREALDDLEAAAGDSVDSEAGTPTDVAVADRVDELVGGLLAGQAEAVAEFRAIAARVDIDSDASDEDLTALGELLLAALSPSATGWTDAPDGYAKTNAGPLGDLVEQVPAAEDLLDHLAETTRLRYYLWEVSHLARSTVLERLRPLIDAEHPLTRYGIRWDDLDEVAASYTDGGR